MKIEEVKIIRGHWVKIGGRWHLRLSPTMWWKLYNDTLEPARWNPEEYEEAFQKEPRDFLILDEFMDPCWGDGS